MIKLAKHRYPQSLMVAYFERTNSPDFTGQTSRHRSGGLGFVVVFFVLVLWAFWIFRG